MPIISAPPQPYNTPVRPAMPIPMRPYAHPMPVPAAARPILVKPPAPPLIPSTIYVGRIPDDVEDSFILNLLTACGPVTQWKRLADPDTGKLKSFGFCEYDNPLSALRALRLLANVEIDGAHLLLNVDSKTQEALSTFEATYKHPQVAQQDEGIAARINQLIEERVKTHPPKPKQEAPTPEAPKEKPSEDKEKAKRRERSRSRSRSRSRRRRAKSRSRSRSKRSRSKSSRSKRSRDHKRSRSRGRRRSRSRSRGRRDHKRRRSRSRSSSSSSGSSSDDKSRSPKKSGKKKSSKKSSSDSESDKSDSHDKSSASATAAAETTTTASEESLDWTKIADSGVIGKSIKPWVVKELHRLLGEESGDELAQFVVESLEGCESPAGLQTELTNQLGEAEAKRIVSELWARLTRKL